MSGSTMALYFILGVLAYIILLVVILARQDNKTSREKKDKS